MNNKPQKEHKKTEVKRGEILTSVQMTKTQTHDSIYQFSFASLHCMQFHKETYPLMPITLGKSAYIFYEKQSQYLIHSILEL